MKIQKAFPVPLFRDFKPHEPEHSPHRIDVSGITETIQRALAAAGLDTRSGPMKGVTDTIHDALSAAGLTQRSGTPSERGVTIEGTAREADAPYSDIDGTQTRPASRVDESLPGAFLNRSFANHAGTRDYMLYVPASYSAESGEPVPVIVMLHGCTQSPDDFAAGTRMNALADEHGFLVIYPAQAANANGSRCWNWFRPEDQVRDSGEPSLIAGITREVASAYCVDARRIFVAGMSAGASMAVILGAMYPELFGAVGAHSGLPYGAAHDMPSAFSAMKGGAARPGPFRPSAATPSHRAQGSSWTPTIIFHGDHDRTVNARNGDAIVEQVTVVASDRQPLRAKVQTGTAKGGRGYRRTDYVDDADQTIVEHWMVHGAGHAWSGGSPTGSFTDPTGPDASAEMIRFFLSRPRAGTS
ncbi:MAG TPA: PHB depolymerase family esterase [Casimicrobiaceae bacterium]|nr:PHB depolymerase family esterase [Casimicrobiaceae bacterium]